MPPAPKPAAQRQRRNRTSTAATLEAAPARKVPLPTRFSPWRCVALVDRKAGCPLPGSMHLLKYFAKAEVEPHDFVGTVIAWHAMTVAWWETIWESPMAAEWVDADVPGLLALAGLVDDYWTNGDARTAAEVRMQQREYGLSPLARRQLQWEIKRLEARPAPAPPSARRRGNVLSVLQGRTA